MSYQYESVFEKKPRKRRTRSVSVPRMDPASIQAAAEAAVSQIYQDFNSQQWEHSGDSGNGTGSGSSDDQGILPIQVQPVFDPTPIKSYPTPRPWDGKRRSRSKPPTRWSGKSKQRGIGLKTSYPSAKEFALDYVNKALARQLENLRRQEAQSQAEEFLASMDPSMAGNAFQQAAFSIAAAVAQPEEEEEEEDDGVADDDGPVVDAVMDYRAAARTKEVVQDPSVYSVKHPSYNYPRQYSAPGYKKKQKEWYQRRKTGGYKGKNWDPAKAAAGWKAKKNAYQGKTGGVSGTAPPASTYQGKGYPGKGYQGKPSASVIGSAFPPKPPAAFTKHVTYAVHNQPEISKPSVVFQSPVSKPRPRSKTPVSKRNPPPSAVAAVQTDPAVSSAYPYRGPPQPMNNDNNTGTTATQTRTRSKSRPRAANGYRQGPLYDSPVKKIGAPPYLTGSSYRGRGRARGRGTRGRGRGQSRGRGRGGGRGRGAPKPTRETRDEYWKAMLSSKIGEIKAPDSAKQELSKLFAENYDVCWDFNTAAGCPRGAECQWKHRRIVISRSRAMKLDKSGRYASKLTVEHPAKPWLHVQLTIVDDDDIKA